MKHVMDVAVHLGSGTPRTTGEPNYILSCQDYWICKLFIRSLLE